MNLLMTALGLLLLAGTVLAIPMILTVRRKMDPGLRPPLLGGLLTFSGQVLLGVALVFNGAGWFGAGVLLATISYALGVLIQRPWRPRRAG